MKRGWIWLAVLLLLAALLVLLPWRGPLVLGDGLFSWGGEVLEPARRAGVLDTLHRLAADDLYQERPEGEEEQAVSFLCDMEKAGIQVLLLTGRPEWGLDPQAAALKEEVDRASALAKRSGGALEGLMVDVEPYLTQSWEEDEARVMEGYVSAMVAARQYANRQGLALLACIPYWYDNDHSEALARLIEEGCDGVAVMNYYRSGEASHIQAEADLARAAKKPVVCIFEFQPPGVHGLTEESTYYADGLAAARQSWEKVRRAVDYDGMVLGYHCYDPIRVLIERIE